MFGSESDFLHNPSLMNKVPTQAEPNNRYIFSCLYLGQGKDLVIINRQTYNLLDWLGDWGGLLDGLRMVT